MARWTDAGHIIKQQQNKQELHAQFNARSSTTLNGISSTIWNIIRIALRGRNDWIPVNINNYI